MKPIDPEDKPITQDSAPEDDVAVYDEAVAGRALKWSAVAVLCILGVAAGAYWQSRKKAAPVKERVTQLTAPTIQRGPAESVPSVRFTDITQSSGIRFSHFNGATGEKLLPETMGGGVAFLDYDGDGDQDLLFINSAPWPWDKRSEQNPTQVLYQNDGTGQFKDVTAGSGLGVTFYGMGAAVGDLDNDGLDDVLISGVGGCRLFHNTGSGKFEETTSKAGVGGGSNDWASAAAFVDYDNDGKLDLFVGHYVRWSREIDHEVGYKLVGVGRAYGQPMNFQGAFSKLYHNEGDGVFADVSEKAGIQVRNAATGVPAGKALGVAPVDLDNDGWMDLVVANDTVQNFVFHNQKNGAFKEIGALSGVAYDSYGKTRGAMGIDAAKFREDDALGIAIANFATEMTGLYVAQRGPLLFADEAITEGIGPAGLLFLKFGLFFFDYDLDGRLDVLTTNGHLEEEIEKIQHEQKYRQPAQLFWNAGSGGANGCFVSVSPDKCGTDLFKRLVGRGSAYADIDGDGDLDVVMTQAGGPPLLLRNECETSAPSWVRLKLVGTSANRDAIGAWIVVEAGGRVMRRQVMPTKSYLSQSELPVTIGLGDASKVDSARVIWPGGKTQQLGDLPTGRTVTITEPANTAAQ